MDDRDVDKLLKQAFSGGSAPEGLGRRVLGDSTAALALSQTGRSAWRRASLAAAAVLIVAVSFLCGRVSVPPGQTDVVAVGPETETISVPNELVAWLEAARFFKQLGMDERVVLAYERAGQLVPQDLPVAVGPPAALYAVEMLPPPAAGSRVEQAENKTSAILANSLGGLELWKRQERD